MSENTPSTTESADDLYDTTPSQQSEDAQRTLAERVLGEHTFGEPGVPRAEDGDGVASDAPRIWSSELHAELFSRDDLTPAYIREFIAEQYDHYDDDDTQRVLRLPDDSEREHGTSWCSYAQYFGPTIVGSDERFYEFWAAEEHDDFSVRVEADYEVGQVHVTVTDNTA